MRDLLRFVRNHVRAARRRLALILLLSVGAAVSQSAGIGLLLPALQMIERPGGSEQTGLIWRTLGAVFALAHLPMALPTLLLGVLAMIVMGQVLAYGHQALTAGLSRDLVILLRRDLFRTLLRADMPFHHAARTGALVGNVTVDAARTGAVLESGLQFAGRGVLLAFYAGMLFVVSWQTSLGALVLVAAVSAFAAYLTRRSRGLGRAIVDAGNELHAFVVERLGAVRIIKLRNAVESDVAWMTDVSRRASDLRFDHEREGAKIRLVMEPTLAAAGIFITYIGFTYLGLSLAELALFMFVLIRMVPEAYALNRLRHSWLGNIEHFISIKDVRQEAERHTTVVSGARPFTGLREGIRLEDVTVLHGPGKTALQGVSCAFEAGRTTAIVGPSGAGKSTILDLITRLVAPQKGEVRLDGIDVREFDVLSLRTSIGVVSQDILLLNDTAIENIRYGCPEASETDVIEAAVKANAHGFIQALPQGYRTVLGARGMTLSGGERQRIELARALLRNPSVLLLDEVTSGLDAESERLIQEAIFTAGRDRTVIIVTHRLNTVHRADKIIVLDQGRIVEEGRPDALLENDGLFRRFHDLQWAESGAQVNRDK
jgi:subfamily B ATP-binding cassette protein MsbA